jgi:PIN domain nuclease of toxin-antitoxin system
VYLLDTHVVVWLAGDPSRISTRASATIHEARAANERLLIAGITLFEIAMLIRRDRIGPKLALDGFLEEIELRFVVLPINRQIASLSVQLPPEYPNDPMDRLIGATAVVHGLPLITADERLRKSKVVETIW